MKHKDFFLEVLGSWNASELSGTNHCLMMISISVILCIWHWKLEFCTKSSCTNSFSVCMSPSFIIGGHAALAALLLLYPSVVLVLVNRTGCRQAHHSWMLCQSGYFSPSSSGCLSSKTWTSLDQPVWVAGRSQFAQAEAARGNRQKAKSTAKLGCFSKGEIITFFPFQEDTCQGSISGKWKDRAVFLCLWSGMITDRKDKCTFSECKGHCQSHRKGGSILPLWEYIKGRREK